MAADAVVSASLDALGSARVLVVPGEDNLGFAQFGLQQQLDNLK